MTHQGHPRSVKRNDFRKKKAASGSIKSPKPKTLAKKVVKLRNSSSQEHLDYLKMFKPVLSQATKAIYLTII